MDAQFRTKAWLCYREGGGASPIGWAASMSATLVTYVCTRQTEAQSLAPTAFHVAVVQRHSMHTPVRSCLRAHVSAFPTVLSTPWCSRSPAPRIPFLREPAPAILLEQVCEQRSPSFSLSENVSFPLPPEGHLCQIKILG